MRDGVCVCGTTRGAEIELWQYLFLSAEVHSKQTEPAQRFHFPLQSITHQRYGSQSSVILKLMGHIGVGGRDDASLRGGGLSTWLAHTPGQDSAHARWAASIT